MWVDERGCDLMNNGDLLLRGNSLAVSRVHETSTSANHPWLFENVHQHISRALKNAHALDPLILLLKISPKKIIPNTEKVLCIEAHHRNLGLEASKNETTDDDEDTG